MCVYVFGAPCKYAPMSGPVHKRAELTEDGYFCGVQYPMAMVLRKSDMKLLSVSTKKFKVYEAAYCAPLDQKLSCMNDRNDGINDSEQDMEVSNEVYKYESTKVGEGCI